jgi:hypothetical protein
MHEKNIAFIVEGLTESIFLRYFLGLHIPDHIHLTTATVGKDNNLEHYKIRLRNPNPEYRILIINAANDDKVLKIMGTHGLSLFKDPVFSVVGLRDMYCDKYDTDSRGKIDQAVTQQSYDNVAAALKLLEAKTTGKMYFFFSVMEVEAWFLAMPSVIRKLGASFDNHKLKHYESLDDVEVIYKPSNALSDIYEAAGSNYTKDESCIEALSSYIDYDDIANLSRSNKSDSFSKFYSFFLEEVVC